MPRHDQGASNEATAEDNTRRVGEVLAEKWRLDELLGVGGMAAVYGATHRNGNRVAIKILHAHCAADESIRSRFQREGYVANMIEHPGAVRVVDDGFDKERVFLVMELLEGETLEARLRRMGRLRVREVLVIADALLDVLAAAHAKGVVHRDVKLDNIFLTTAGEVKVLDFGIARLAESPDMQRFGRTHTGAVMGTPAFMAPEQALARSSEIDAQTDVWAVGATLFKTLTGRYVHEATTMNEQLVQAATRPAPPLASVLPDAPADLALVVDRALAFHKADRWPSARAMQEAVRAVLEAKQPTPTSLPPPIPPVHVTTTFSPPATPSQGLAPVESRRGARRFPVVVVGTAVAALLVALTAAWVSSHMRGTPVAGETRPSPPASVAMPPAVAAPPLAPPPPSTPPPSSETGREPARPSRRAHAKRSIAAKEHPDTADRGADDDIFSRRH